MLYHDHAQSLYVEHKLPRCTSCSGTLAYSAKTPKQIYLSTAGKGLNQNRPACTYQHTPALVPLGGVLVGVLTSILLPLCFWGCSRGCTYQHTPALVPLGVFSWVCMSVLTSILLPIYLSGEFLWVCMSVLTSILLALYFWGCSRECTYQHTPALVPLGGVFSWVYLPAYSCPCTSRGVLVGWCMSVLTSILLLLYLSGEFSWVCMSVLTSILMPLYLWGFLVGVYECTYQHTHALVPLGFSRGCVWVYLPAYSCPYTSRGNSCGCVWVYLPAYSWPCTSGGVLVSVLTSILMPLYLSGACSRGCTYQHTHALVPLGEFSWVGAWVYLPAYSYSCTSRGNSRGCVWVYLPAYSCPCTSGVFSWVCMSVLTSILMPLYLWGFLVGVYECTYQYTPALVPLGGVFVLFVISRPHV